MRVPQRVSPKWPLLRHQIRNFKNREKRHLQIYSRSFVESFIKIGSFVWAVEMTHTDTHTDTHPGFDCNIFSHFNSVKMTEYNKHKNGEKIQILINELN